jgi:predicted GIY-YIG superfamily endonuclease
MILPYVYKLTHKETEQFYIGYTRQNTKLMKHPSEENVKYIKMEDIEEYINKGYSFVNRNGEEI